MNGGVIINKKILIDAITGDEPVHINQLIEILDLKERTIRELIRVLKEDGKDNGFEVCTVPSKGYMLDVKDPSIFEAYYSNLDEDVYSNKRYRIMKTLYYLLQQSDYVSMNDLAEMLSVSRNTVISDSQLIHEFLVPFDLVLDSKPHYGIKIVGDEHNVRHAISKYVLESEKPLENTETYFDYIANLDVERLRDVTKKLFEQYNVSVSVDAMNSIVDHIKILFYRAKDHNFISSITESTSHIPQEYYDIATKLGMWIKEEEKIDLPKEEIYYLASQIAGRTSISTISDLYKYLLVSQIHDNLKIIDEEFDSEFSEDEIIKEALFMHMYPLLMRISHKMELQNPLIDLVSSRYANVFLVALRFVELWNTIEFVDISIDEIGYIALHFAGHFERKKLETLNSVRRVLIVSELGRGNMFLNKHKISSILPNATIGTASIISLDEIDAMDLDVVFSSVDFESDRDDCQTPIIKIDELIEEEDLPNLKESVIACQNIQRTTLNRNYMSELLNEKFYRKIKSGDYLQEIESLANSMVDEGYADASFPELVLKRERIVTTVYGNGVAGPHGMKLNAIEESIGVIIVEEDMTYNDSKIRIIFLLNICKGSLFLYREITRFLTAIMNDSDLVDQLVNASDYKAFLKTVDTIKY
ncbi:BglG family transcription antiterminator [Erysipelothrix sp. HDW6A]|uniref:BglG family transcription antiterminator n=1 Tax=Erysipelothrix sp. HDW6A TaxID=2714928 RepID=UPI00140767C0|nr:PRD domain-containing protein [Erysipelothrix sp. HDW6A]QIK58128.1 BglG family transcription antiterminator [Erysipelothrix sp. HDW6A]